MLAFETPASFASGNAGRRIIFDFSMGMRSQFAESATARFQGETFNHPHLVLPGALPPAASFGVMNSAPGARVLQFGLRIVF